MDHRSSFSSTSGTAQRIPANLTEAQTGLWYAQRLDPANPIFNTGHYTEIHGRLNVAAFDAAVNQAMREADSLSLRMLDLPDAPMQVLDEALRPRLRHVDLRQDDDAFERALAAMRRDMATPIDPTAGPLACEILFIVADDRYIWYQRVHHLATDGYGMALIEARVARLYAALLDGRSDAGDSLAPFEQVQAEDQAYRLSPKRDDDAAYWRSLLAPLEPAVSLADGAPVTSSSFLYATLELEPGFVSALRDLEARSDVSWPDILTALTAAYLARHTRQSDIVVGVPFMGRLGSVSARAAATVMNVLPLPVAVDEQAGLDDYLIDVSRRLRKARRHGRYRSEQLKRDLGLLGGRRRLHGPLINVLPFDAAQTLKGLDTKVHVLGAGPVDDLTITYRAGAGGQRLRLEIEANPALYAHGQIQEHLPRLQCFLERAVQADTLSQVATLTDAEYRHWVYEVNDTARDIPDTTLAELIGEAMLAHPQAIALSDGTRHLTYEELNERTRRIARALYDLGVRRGDSVAVAMPRGIELTLALVGIVRAGAAYLPLDIQHPRERLNTLLQMAAPRAALVTPDTLALLPEGVTRLVIDAGRNLTDASPELPRDQAPTPKDAAYILFTSGSTGAPKGVVIEHDAIVNRLLWMKEHYGIDADDRILQKTPVTFDVSVWEFFLPLISGATLVMAPPESHKDPAWLADILREQAVTTLHFVPSMLAVFLEEPRCRDLKPARVFCSGEELPAALRDLFHQRLPHTELHNLYGPTEAAVDVSYWPASKTDASQPVPIGFPVWNTALYVLDELLRPVPPGIAGHLYLAGRQLARGYLGRPDLTEERFVPNPFDAASPRMYATGDLARWRDDGAVVFLGRSDHQIKLRGQRLELGEIEAVIAHAPGVARVAVIARQDRPGNTRLVAYAVAHDASAADTHALLAHAEKLLPDYMVPSAVVWLDELPVTNNGKLDRKALPAPALSTQVSRTADTPTERYIADLFQDVLQLERQPGADDDFFELGGHSLLAAKMAARIRQNRQPAFSLGAIFEHATVSRLAAYVDDASATNPDGSSANGFGSVVTLKAGDKDKNALFCIHPAGGISWCYGTLARAMEPGRTVYGLQAPGLHPHLREGTNTLDSMAQAYVDTLLQLQEHGPYHLAGWSVGGIIAQAMAAELQRRGLQVGVLAMLDAYPSDCWRDQPEPPRESVYKALLHIAGHDPEQLPDVPLTRDGVIGFLRATGHPLGELPDAMLEGVFHVVGHNNRLVRRHRHACYDGPALYFRAALDHIGENLSPQQWEPYVGALEVHDIPSLHAHLTGPEATARIAPVLNDRLGRSDASCALPAETHP